RTEDLMRTTLIALLSLAAAAAAQGQIAEPHIADDGGAPRVYYAHSYYSDHQNMAGLDDRVSVHVQNFGALLKQVNGNCSNIVLFMNGMALKGLQAESCDEGQGHVRYLLRRTPDADDVWHKLLGSPHHYAKQIGISVGADPQFAIRSDVTSF